MITPLPMETPMAMETPSDSPSISGIFHELGYHDYGKPHFWSFFLPLVAMKIMIY